VIKELSANRYFSAADRDVLLKACGFQAYTEYLESSLWDWIRSQLLLLPNSDKCICCKSTTGLVWHHRTYSPEVMVGNFTSVDQPIVRLCNGCHKAIHFNGKLKQYLDDLFEVDKRLLQLEDAHLWRDSILELYKSLDEPPSRHEEFGGY
jgi:hypothetical protein